MPGLARRLGTADAVVIGLGSMIGAGVFSAFAPAAAAAGSGLLVGLAVAAGIAYCNAVASAQLAARYPTSGGTYVYGRERLGEWWGFAAGWAFVIGKTASCAAMALTFAAYAAPGSPWLERGLAIAAVVVLTAVNVQGISRTATLARVLVAGSLLSLAAVVVVTLASGRTDVQNLVPGDLPTSPYGILQSAGLLFFAFAGYARIATLGEEVLQPERTIPRAIPIALGITVAVYLLVGTSALLVAGQPRSPLAPPHWPRPSRRRARPGHSRSFGSARSWRASAPCSPSSRASAARRWRWLGRATCRADWPPWTPSAGFPRRPRSRSRRS